MRASDEATYHLTMMKVLWHVWRKGHSVKVHRDITIPLADTSKGWLYRCECGGVVAR